MLVGDASTRSGESFASGRGDDTIDRVQRHVIDDRAYYCCTVRDWSFHVPVDHWHGPDLAVESPADQTDADADDKATPRELTDFTKDGEAVDSDLSLQAALLCVQSLTGLSVNEFLAEAYVRYDDGSVYLAGWRYLDWDGARSTNPCPGTDPLPPAYRGSNPRGSVIMATDDHGNRRTDSITTAAAEPLDPAAARDQLRSDLHAITFPSRTGISDRK